MKCYLTSLLLFLSFTVCSQVYIPNAFSPNGDGHNDIFVVSSQDTLSRYYLRIYNCYGELVFESQNQNEPWLGGNEYYSQSDKYVYLLTWLETKPAIAEKKIKGSVTLLR